MSDRTAKTEAAFNEIDDLATVYMRPVAHTEISAHVVSREEKESHKRTEALLKEFRL